MKAMRAETKVTRGAFLPPRFTSRSFSMLFMVRRMRMKIYEACDNGKDDD
jgi:hypothetical protein